MKVVKIRQLAVKESLKGEELKVMLKQGKDAQTISREEASQLFYQPNKVLLLIGEGVVIKGLQLKVYDKNYAIFEPDHSLVLLYMGHRLIEEAERRKKILFKSHNELIQLLEFEPVVFTSMHFISISNFLHTSIEAFVNQSMSDDYMYQDTSSKLYKNPRSKDFIQERSGFIYKVSKILPDAFKKLPFQEIDDLNQQQFDLILQNKEIRDSFIHIHHKDPMKNTMNDVTYTSLFTADFYALFNAIKNLMNYYLPNHVELIEIQTENNT